MHGSGVNWMIFSSSKQKSLFNVQYDSLSIEKLEYFIFMQYLEYLQ